MTELFAPGKDTLAIYNFMFGPEMKSACPSCTQFLDSFDGVAEHASQRINVAVVARSPLPRILTHARRRGWRRLHLLSSAGNTYNRDYFGETPEGDQIPMLNVFRRDGGAIRHFWGSELMFAPTEPGQDPRHTTPSIRSGACSTTPPTGGHRLGPRTVLRLSARGSVRKPGARVNPSTRRRG